MFCLCMGPLPFTKHLMYWYNNDIEAALDKRKAYEGQSPIVFYGSSSIRLWSTLKNDLQPWPLLNLGFGGSTIAACCWFAKKLFATLDPRALVLYAGDNDLGDGRHPEEVVNQFRLMAYDWEKRYPNKPMFYISIKHSPARAHLYDSIEYTNKQIKSLCENSLLCHFIDIVPVMKKEGHVSNPAFFSQDGLHMNAQGYAAWTTVVRSALDNHLEAPG